MTEFHESQNNNFARHHTPPHAGRITQTVQYTPHAKDGGTRVRCKSAFIGAPAGIAFKSRCSHNTPTQKDSTAYAIGAKIAAANSALTTKATVKYPSICSPSRRHAVGETLAAVHCEREGKIHNAIVRFAA